MEKSKTLLEVLGWGQSDLDPSGIFVTIGIHNSEVAWFSKSSNKEKVVQLKQAIKEGAKLKFHKVFQYYQDRKSVV